MKFTSRTINLPAFILLLSTLLFFTATVSSSTIKNEDIENINDIPIEEQVCTEDNQRNCQAKNDNIIHVDEGMEEENDDDYIPMLGDDDDDIADDDDDTFDDFYDDDGYYDEDFLDEEIPCKDKDGRCQEWAESGECAKNPNYMLSSCPKSCNTCRRNTIYGIPQENDPNLEHHKEVSEILLKMEKYMQEEIRDNPDLSYLLPRCKNRHKECAFWAHIGECNANPRYMLTNCAPVCNTCHLLDFKTRCPLKPDEEDAFKRGSLNKMFRRIVDDRDFGNITSTVLTEKGIDLDASSFKLTVLSRPEPPKIIEEKREEESQDYKIGPWVVIIDNFVHEKECDRLIELGSIEGYERSEDVGKELFDGSYDSVQSSSRTSWNAWCTGGCYEDPMAKAVAARIEQLTGIPEPNSENLQLLRYHEGQFYKTHHDYIDNQEEFPAGPRLLTAFLYLNDVEAGGGTNFPKLDITVMPKKGRLLLWPSVTDFNPFSVDRRTTHQALPVEKGIKYAANAWLHMRDFKEPNERNCT